MNTNRTLRVANIFFIICGYQLHYFNRTTNDFRISVFSVLFFLGYVSWYVACVCKYFLEHVILVVLLQGVSPFLYDCMKLHLLVGIKITVLMLIEAKRIAKASTHLAQVFGNILPVRFTLTEMVVYLILFLNPILNIVLGIYDISMVRPKHFNLDNIMVLSAVYLPHFNVACSLKYLCIVMWLMTQSMIGMLVDTELILTTSDAKCMASMVTIEEPITMTSLEMTTRSQTYDLSPLDRSIDLNRILERIKATQLVSIEFNAAIQKQLNVLILVSVLVLVEASYAFMYYDLIWNEVLFDNYRNAFLATFAGFYVFVAVDFIGLFLASHILAIKKQKFLEYIDGQLRCRDWSYDINKILKEIKITLQDTGRFKIFFVFDINWQIFILGGCQILIIVALFTLFQYVKHNIIF